MNPLPPLTVEAMRRFCQEMMKDGKGDYVFHFSPYIIADEEAGTEVRKIEAINGEKTVELS